MTATPDQLGPRDLDALRTLLAREPRDNLYLLGLLEEFGVQAGERRERARLSTAASSATSSSPRSSSAATAAWRSPSRRRLHRARGALRVAPPAGSTSARCRATSSRSTSCCKHLGAEEAGARAHPAAVRGLRRRPRPVHQPDAAAGHRGRSSPAAPDGRRRRCGAVRARPARRGRRGFRARVLQRIRGKRTYVLEEDGALVFKIDVGSRSKHGAELEGLYTAPDERRRGHATLSLGQISRHLLSSLPRLTLRVRRSRRLARRARAQGRVRARAAVSGWWCWTEPARRSPPPALRRRPRGPQVGHRPGLARRSRSRASTRCWSTTPTARRRRPPTRSRCSSRTRRSPGLPSQMARLAREESAHLAEGARADGGARAAARPRRRRPLRAAAAGARAPRAAAPPPRPAPRRRGGRGAQLRAAGAARRPASSTRRCGASTRELAQSEDGHQALFFRLAALAHGEAEARARLEQLLEAEAAVIAELPLRAAIH